MPLLSASGATGGWAAKELTEAGLRVCLLEAGRNLNPEKDFTEHMTPYQIKYRGQSPEMKRTRPIQSKNYACREYNYKWFVNDLKNPYTTPEGKPFDWFRLRILGGRSMVWGRQSYRFSDLDFKAASRDGYGQDWPFSYADLAPYYDKVEEYIGVSGQAEGKSQLPDGKFLPPMKMTCGELILRESAMKKFGRTVTIGRTAMLTKPLNGRAPCHYCGPCEQGCTTHSYFNSPTTTVAAAQATGNLTLLTDSIAHQVLIDPKTGKAKGVSYIDRETRAPREVLGKVVVLCAQALESTRILFNSANREYPNGLANSSGTLGCYLMDHVMGGGASGVFPSLREKPNFGSRRPNGIYVARYQNVKNQHPDFIRGYGFQGGAGPRMNTNALGIGKAYKEAVKDGIYGVSLGGFGECLARRENRCEIDESVADAWGIPALRVSCSYGDNEHKMLEDMSATAAEMLEAAGVKNVSEQSRESTFGRAIHEVGTARMGNDSRTSVLNKWCQAHDIKNLFVADGSCFVSSGNQNPTLTMMALTARLCDYLVEQYRKGEV